jgi:phosphate transport system substrate-binding protein
LYPEAELTLRGASSAEAVRALFAAECDLAVISRELEPDEQTAAVRGGLQMEGYRVARDALVVVVAPENPVKNLALDDLRRIYAGEIKRWSELGGVARDIVPVIQEPKSDIMAFFTQQVMNGEPIVARSMYAASDSAVAVYVAGHSDAIGFKSMAGPTEGVRAMRMSSLTGLSYRPPDAEAVYEGDYPLSRGYNLYLRDDGPRLAHGFVTFVTSLEGQRIVRDLGLVPTAVPVRFVRRSPMRSSH